MHAWERMHVNLITALHSYYHMLGEENMLYFKFGGVHFPKLIPTLKHHMSIAFLEVFAG